MLDLNRMAGLRERLNAPAARRRLIIATSLLLIVAAVLLSIGTRLTPYARDRVLEALGARFDAQIELRSFQLSIFPRPEISGEGLVIRHRGRTDVPPLISIESFSAAAGLLGLVQRPLRLHSVTVDGLHIRLSPDRDGPDDENRPRDEKAGDTRGTAGSADAARAEGRAGNGGAANGIASSLVIGRITSTDARLEIPSSKPGKLPRVFRIHRLVLDEFGLDRPATFEAALTNPKPAGEIETQGQFGPWDRENPRATPIDGTYTFTDADLGTIKGISGTLSSRGSFTGVLERLEVQGDTDTPDFSVDVAGQPVHLKTQFKAIVDGTNGDTWLQPVVASVLQTEIRAEGAVVRSEDVKGRIVKLDVTVEKGRIEDLLKLAMKSKTTPLAGNVTLKTKLEIPPGDRDVVEKLRLDGEFSLREARFTNFNIQKRIDMLSRRGRGDTDDSDGESVVSDMKARFVLRDGSLALKPVTFSVPGAGVRLNGIYSLTSETLDFKGDLLLAAKLSETTTGWKATLAKLAQPLFRGPGGGSRIPITIGGTREKPKFGLDVKRAITPGD